MFRLNKGDGEIVAAYCIEKLVDALPLLRIFLRNQKVETIKTSMGKPYNQDWGWSSSIRYNCRRKHCEQKDDPFPGYLIDPICAHLTVKGRAASRLRQWLSIILFFHQRAASFSLPSPRGSSLQYHCSSPDRLFPDNSRDQGCHSTKNNYFFR